MSDLMKISLTFNWLGNISNVHQSGEMWGVILSDCHKNCVWSYWEWLTWSVMSPGHLSGQCPSAEIQFINDLHLFWKIRCILFATSALCIFFMTGPYITDINDLCHLEYKPQQWNKIMIWIWDKYYLTAASAGLFLWLACQHIIRHLGSTSLWVGECALVSGVMQHNNFLVLSQPWLGEGQIREQG